MTQITLSVPDISCGHCKSSIEGALGPFEGVQSAIASVQDRNVDVEYDPAEVDLAAIVAAIDDQGYEVETPRVIA